MLSKSSKIFVAGHNGLVGSALVRRLNFFGYNNLIVRNRKQLDLRIQAKVENFFKQNKIDAVINAAGTVGGIYANNKYKADFIYDNLAIQNNIIHSCHNNNVKNLIFLGSSCIYPKFSKQPIKEKFILTGQLEQTNDAYAIAKIAGIMMCKNYTKDYGLNYKCLMPSNMYGPNDNYNLQNSHFFPALMRKIYEAKIFKKKEVKVWGSGKVFRELLYVDDLADAILFFINKKIKEDFINIGSGNDHSIRWYVKFIMKQLKVRLKVKYDSKKPDGDNRKLLDTSLAKKYGWRSKTSLEKGFLQTIKDFVSNYNS